MALEGLLLDLYQVVQAVDNLVQFGEIVASISTPDGNAQDLIPIEAALQDLSGQIQQSSTQILAALTTLDQQIFGANMADKLSYADQSGIALALWEKEQTEPAREQALDTSEAGVAGMVELYGQGVYPGPAMVLVLARILLARLAVLGVFPDARTTADTAQLESALASLTTSTEAIGAQVQAANQVHVTTQHGTLPGRPPIDFYIVTVLYANLLGDAVYNKSALGRTFADAQAAAQPLLAAASLVEAQGLAEDLDHAQVTSLRKIIETIRPIVG